MHQKHEDRLNQHSISSRRLSTAVWAKFSASGGQKISNEKMWKKVGLDWPYPQEVSQQHCQAGSDLGSTLEAKEGKTLKPHGTVTPRQKCIKAATAGRSWKRQLRVRCTGGVLPMA